MTASLTAHARIRMQQRGIPAAMVEALLDYGKVAHVDAGREIVFFDKVARRRFTTQNPHAARNADRLVRTYAILGAGGVVITVGARFRRIPRH